VDSPLIPEAIHGIVGDEVERLIEWKDHVTGLADLPPSLAERAPVEDLVVVGPFSRSESGDGSVVVFEVERVASRILTNVDPAATTLVIE
jgi:hypothetical protein